MNFILYERVIFCILFSKRFIGSARMSRFHLAGRLFSSMWVSNFDSVPESFTNFYSARIAPNKTDRRSRKTS